MNETELRVTATKVDILNKAIEEIRSAEASSSGSGWDGDKVYVNLSLNSGSFQEAVDILRKMQEDICKEWSSSVLENYPK